MRGVERAEHLVGRSAVCWVALTVVTWVGRKDASMVDLTVVSRAVRWAASLGETWVGKMDASMVVGSAVCSAVAWVG